MKQIITFGNTHACTTPKLSVYPNTSGSSTVHPNTCDVSSITYNTNQNNVAPQVIITQTMIPFVKENSNSQAYKYVDTEFSLTIVPCLSYMNNQQHEIDYLSTKMLEIRDDAINTVKTVYASEVQNRINQSPYCQQSDYLLDPRFCAIISQ